MLRHQVNSFLSSLFFFDFFFWSCVSCVYRSVQEGVFNLKNEERLLEVDQKPFRHFTVSRIRLQAYKAYNEPALDRTNQDKILKLRIPLKGIAL